MNLPYCVDIDSGTCIILVFHVVLMRMFLQALRYKPENHANVVPTGPTWGVRTTWLAWEDIYAIPEPLILLGKVLWIFRTSKHVQMNHYISGVSPHGLQQSAAACIAFCCIAGPSAHADCTAMETNTGSVKLQFILLGTRFSKRHLLVFQFPTSLLDVTSKKVHFALKRRVSSHVRRPLL